MAHSTESRGKTLFLDRDGTIIVERDYLREVDDVVLENGAAQAIKLFVENGFSIVVVTNQSGIGRGYFSLRQVHLVNKRVEKLLREHGAKIDAWYHCPHTPLEKCLCRKPQPGMIFSAAKDLNVDFDKSILVGDKRSDVEAGRAANLTSFLVATGYGEKFKYWAKCNGVTVYENLLDMASNYFQIEENQINVIS